MTNSLYATGTVSAQNGVYAITFADGAAALDINMKPGDRIEIDGGKPNAIDSLVDPLTALLVRPFEGATGEGLSFIVYQMPGGWGDRVELSALTGETIRKLGEQVPVQKTLVDSVATQTKRLDGLDDDVAALEARPSNGVVKKTWAALSALTGLPNATPGEATEDAGTHTDPIVGGTVPNAGRYSFVTGTPNGWQWIGETGIGALNATAARAELYETTIPRRFAFLDADGRVYFSSEDIDRPFTEAETYESTDDDDFRVVDTDGRVLARFSSERDAANAAQVLAAQGSADTLAARLAVSLDSAGYPIDYIWGAWFLRQTRMRLQALARGEAMQFAVAAFGDSWTQAASRYIGPVAESLIADYGDCGSGWIGFGYPTGAIVLRNGNVRPAVYTLYNITSFTPTYFTGETVDLGLITSSTAGSKVTVMGPDGDASFWLHFIGTADGVVRHRWNGGAWNANLALPDITPAGTQTRIALTGKPAGAFTLEIEVVSGTVQLVGMDCQKASSGVKVHKLAATGSNTQHWINVPAAKLKAGLALLDEVHLVIIAFGTNDQPFIQPPAFRANLIELIDRARSVNPGCDVLLIIPCENLRTDNPRPMTDYARVMLEVARLKGCAFLNLQYVFGDTPADYAAGSARPWFQTDLIHPEPLTGGRAIADATLRLLTKL